MSQAIHKEDFANLYKYMRIYLLSDSGIGDLK